MIEKHSGSTQLFYCISDAIFTKSNVTHLFAEGSSLSRSLSSSGKCPALNLFRPANSDTPSMGLGEGATMSTLLVRFSIWLSEAVANGNIHYRFDWLKIWIVVDWVVSNEGLWVIDQQIIYCWCWYRFSFLGILH